MVATTGIIHIHVYYNNIVMLGINFLLMGFILTRCIN
jgi:hypothetical protein